MSNKVDVASPEDIKREKLEKYNHVVGAAQIRAVQMMSVSFKVKPDFFSEEEKRALSYDVKNGDHNFSTEDGAAMIFVSFNVSAQTGRKKTLVCEADYVVTYDGLNDCDDEAVKAFLGRVAPFACYPYFRSLFATLDWAATTGLPPLPVHKEPARTSPARKKIGGKPKEETVE